MKIHPHEDLLVEMLCKRGEVSARLLEHLDGCAACRAKLQALERRSPVPRRVARVLPWPRPALDYSAALLASARSGERHRSTFAQEPLAFLSGPERVASVGVVSGGAPGEIHAAIAAGLDAYVTGEASEWVMNVARENGGHG